MKKYLFIILICIVWFIVPTHSKAYTDEQKELFKEEYYDIYGFYLNEYSLNEVLEKWEDKGVTNNFNCPYLYTLQETSRYANFRLCTTNDRIQNNDLVCISGDCSGSPTVSVVTSSNNTAWYITTNSFNGTYSNPLNLHDWGSFDEWNASHVDYSWTNVSYDSSIPTPSINVDLSKNLNEKVFNNISDATLFGQLGPEIPYYLGFKASSAYEGYYLYLDMTIWTPTSGELKLENGIYSFIPKSMYRTEDIPYLDWSDLTPAPTTNNKFYWTNANMFGSTIEITQQENLNQWYNIRRHIELGTSEYPEMEYSSNLSGTSRENGISRINQMLRNASLAGNRVRFRACLYYINENNEIKCGNFATWTSAQPSTPTTEQPSTNAQVVDQPASGISQTVSYDNIVSQNENTNSIPPVNVTTGGSNINVTVNTGEQNVPNNQNYPTVVSYNHDNIFTTFIGTYNSASQYLGGFAAFCNSCLLWIPSEIWSIIGMGFAMAIVIMIVKIL